MTFQFLLKEVNWRCYGFQVRYLQFLKMLILSIEWYKQDSLCLNSLRLLFLENIHFLYNIFLSPRFEGQCGSQFSSESHERNL